MTPCHLPGLALLTGAGGRQAPGQEHASPCGGRPLSFPAPSELGSSVGLPLGPLIRSRDPAPHPQTDGADVGSVLCFVSPEEGHRAGTSRLRGAGLSSRSC